MRLRGWRQYGLGAGGMLLLVMAFMFVNGWGSAMAAQITSVFVTNDSSHAVPVREQALDANGNIKVHEQGTGNVTVVGDVRTRPAVPTGAFSLHLDPAPRLVASGPDAAGTDYAITSITAANDSDSPDHVHIHAFYGGSSLNCATGTGVQDLSDGP